VSTTEPHPSSVLVWPGAELPALVAGSVIGALQETTTVSPSFTFESAATALPSTFKTMLSVASAELGVDDVPALRLRTVMLWAEGSADTTRAVILWILPVMVSWDGFVVPAWGSCARAKPAQRTSADVSSVVFMA